MRFDFDKVSRFVTCEFCGYHTWVLRVREERLKEPNNGGGLMTAHCRGCSADIDMQEILGKVAKLAQPTPPPTKQPKRATG